MDIDLDLACLEENTWSEASYNGETQSKIHIFAW